MAGGATIVLFSVWSLFALHLWLLAAACFGGSLTAAGCAVWAVIPQLKSSASSEKLDLEEQIPLTADEDTTGRHMCLPQQLV